LLISIFHGIRVGNLLLNFLFCGRVSVPCLFAMWPSLQVNPQPSLSLPTQAETPLLHSPSKFPTILRPCHTKYALSHSLTIPPSLHPSIPPSLCPSPHLHPSSVSKPQGQASQVYMPVHIGISLALAGQWW
jgi:hypothetical protein